MSTLVLTASTRHGSYTRTIGEAIAGIAGDGVVSGVDRLPFFNQDLESDPPAPVEALRAAVQAATLVVIVTAEYNGAVPGVLGNALDWLSRPYGAGALHGKPVITLAASPGDFGGARALAALREVLMNIGARLAGSAHAIGRVHERVADGVPDAALRAQLHAALEEGRALDLRAA